MTNPVGIRTKPKPPAKKPTDNGGMGSGKAPAAIEGDRDLDVETHKNKPRVKPQTLSKAFESAGYITTMAEDKQGVIVPQNSETLAKHLTNKGWSYDSYQVKNGSRIESLSKGSNRITLCGEGSRTVAYATRGHVTNQRESVMTKEEKTQIIQALTSNCKCQTANQFDESDKEYLSGLSDEKLQLLATNRQKLIDADKKAKATANQETPEEDETETPAMTANSSKSKTASEPSLQEWLKAAPKEVRSAVLNAQRIEAKQKESLISKLTANVRDEDKLENLKGIYGNMSVETLESLVEALPAAPVATQNRRQPNYGGAGSPIYTQQQTATANAEETNDLVSAMTPPTFNWSEIAGQKDNGRRISK